MRVALARAEIRAYACRKHETERTAFKKKSEWCFRVLFNYTMPEQFLFAN